MSLSVLIFYILKDLSCPLSSFCPFLQTDELQEPGRSSQRGPASEAGLAGFPVVDQKANLEVWAEFYFELLFA